MKISILIFTLLLSGCVTKYVAVPDELTQHCDVHQPRSTTVDEAVRLANVRKDSIDDCNSRMDKIRAIQGTVIKKF